MFQQDDTEQFKRTLNDSIDRATLLAVAAVDTLGHINVIASRPATSVHTLFSFDGDSLGRTDGFTKFACNAALFARWVASKGVFTTEPRRDRAFLEGVENGVTG